MARFGSRFLWQDMGWILKNFSTISGLGGSIPAHLLIAHPRDRLSGCRFPQVLRQFGPNEATGRCARASLVVTCVSDRRSRIPRSPRCAIPDHAKAVRSRDRAPGSFGASAPRTRGWILVCVRSPDAHAGNNHELRPPHGILEARCRGCQADRAYEGENDSPRRAAPNGPGLPVWCPWIGPSTSFPISSLGAGSS